MSLLLMTDISTTIDLSHAEQGAIKLRDRLIALRVKYDVTPFEYCKQLCIAPYTVPHSHPVVTLNTYFPTETGLLATYVHEQMHWYVTWYSHAHTEAWLRVFSSLAARYPDPPVGGDQGARDRYSSHLHLIVNWLEIEALSGLIGREPAIAEARSTFHYRWLYARVLEDWAALGTLYRDNELAPIRSAHDMSAEDIALAARMDEAR
jgi:hypothetical protein